LVKSNRTVREGFIPQRGRKKEILIFEFSVGGRKEAWFLDIVHGLELGVPNEQERKKKKNISQLKKKSRFRSPGEILGGGKPKKRRGITREKTSYSEGE